MTKQLDLNFEYFEQREEEKQVEIQFKDQKMIGFRTNS